MTVTVPRGDRVGGGGLVVGHPFLVVFCVFF